EIRKAEAKQGSFGVGAVRRLLGRQDFAKKAEEMDEKRLNDIAGGGEGNQAIEDAFRKADSPSSSPKKKKKG
ncbi:unnamed protein product, partial [Amoebophrya sp. A25]